MTIVTEAKMINCPNCGAENADNANHCGNCGTKLQAGGGAKTMFGFAAVSQEDMKKAAEEARAAGELANKPKLQSPTLPTPSIPAPSLPAPSVSPSSSPALSAAPKFNIPAPSSLSGSGSEGSEIPTQMTPAIESSNDDFGMGDTQLPGDLAEATARLEEELAQPSSHTTQPEPAVHSAPDQILPVQAPNAPMSPTDFGGGGGGGFGGGGGGGFGGGGGGTGTRTRGEVRDPVKMVILTYVTCGFYGLLLIINIMNELNAAFGEERYSVARDLILGFITCGAYSIYLFWKIANDIEELQTQWGVEPKFAAPILFLMNLFYIGPWGMQTSLNNAWENGNPPA